MKWISRLAAVSAVAAAIVSTASGAAARPVTLHLKFRGSGVAALGVATNLRYAFIEPYYPTDGSLGILIDDRTGMRKQLVRSGCRDTQAGEIVGPWLVFDCPASPSDQAAPELYSLATGAWRAVSADPSLVGYCSTESCVRPSRAGSTWLQYDVSDCPDGEHCSGHSDFQNLATGQLRRDPTGGRTITDLNSPDLARELCDPLRVPNAVYTYGGPHPGSVTMDGRFAIASGTDQNGNPRAYLERCGSRRRQLLKKGPYANAPVAVGWNQSTVVWQSAPYQLSGLFLPSLRPFRVSFPPGTVTPNSCWSPDDCFLQIALTRRTLYLLGGGGQEIWSARAPVPPLPRATRTN